VFGDAAVMSCSSFSRFDVESAEDDRRRFVVGDLGISDSMRATADDTGLRIISIRYPNVVYIHTR